MSSSHRAFWGTNCAVMGTIFALLTGCTDTKSTSAITMNDLSNITMVSLDNDTPPANLLTSALVKRAKIIVVAANTPGDVRRAGEIAHNLNLPVVVDSTDFKTLKTSIALTVGDVPALPNTIDKVSVAPNATSESLTKYAAKKFSDTKTIVIAPNNDAFPALNATANAVGAQAISCPTSDPRACPDAIKALSSNPQSNVVQIGHNLDQQHQEQRLDLARTGVQLPGGGQVLFPGRRLVAFYGSPTGPALGLLGERPIDATIQRLHEMVAKYNGVSAVPVVGAFEIIVTVASAVPGHDGNRSTELEIEKITPWLDAAAANNIYVFLDLQPGTTNFLTQAKQYEELLKRPNVGLALDPEWRLKPGQRHLEQIGSVEAAEVNQVHDWLSQLVRDNKLPQKLFVLHQFNLSMITKRETLHTSNDELAVLIHADGQGQRGAKFGTWRALRANAPDGVWWGWKNFIDEDPQMLTPEQTYAIAPAPDLVSYQ